MDVLNRSTNQMTAFDYAVELMDDDIREAIHSDLAPCTEQEFLDEYVIRHAAKHGNKFFTNQIRGEPLGRGKIPSQAQPKKECCLVTLCQKSDKGEENRPYAEFCGG